MKGAVNGQRGDEEIFKRSKPVNKSVRWRQKGTEWAQPKSEG